MSEIVVASQGAAVTLDDGIPHVIQAGVTMARDTHPIVTGYPDLWKPLDVTYDVEEPPKAPARTAAAAKK